MHAGPVVPNLERVDVAAEPARIADLRRVLAQWLQSAGLDEERCHAAVLAGYEAMANVVEHAYRDNAEPGTLDLCAALSDDGATIEITVTDRGRWCKPQAGTLRGRGLALMQELAERTAVEMSDLGTRVVMGWKL